MLRRYSSGGNKEFVGKMYDEIIGRLGSAECGSGPGARLWLRINMSRLREVLENGPLEQCPGLIAGINNRLVVASDLTRSSYALDVIAAEIEYCFRTLRHLPTLTALYKRSRGVSSAMTHPRVMGVIGECGATIHFFRGNYDAARTEFYDCFKHYDEAGSVAKKKVLKYLALCCVLSDSAVNPFESHETQSYAALPDYANLLALLRACDCLDLDTFNHVLEKMAKHNDPLVNDPLFVVATTAILNSLKRKLLLGIFTAYKRVSFEFLVKRLRLPNIASLESMLVKMAQSGYCHHLQINFALLHISLYSSPPPCLVSLDPPEIHDSLAVSNALSFTGPWPPVSNQLNLSPMDIDESPSENSSVLHITIPPSLLLPHPDYTDAVREWLLSMKSALYNPADDLDHEDIPKVDALVAWSRTLSRQLKQP